MRLLRASPALDHGTNFGLTIDQRWQPRRVDTAFANGSGDGTDIGAVELNLIAGTDIDQDDMSDDFETFFGFNPHNGGDASADAVRDGLTNLQEFEAGTDPFDSNSALQIIDLTDNANAVAVMFAPAISGKTYRLEHRAPLKADASWSSVPGAGDVTASTTGPLQLTDPNGTMGGEQFYRVQIVP
jgi:hypothetical protein